MPPDYSHIQQGIDLGLSLQGRHLLVAPTGSGKTSVGCGIYKAAPETTLILVPTDEIGDGWAKNLGMPQDKTKREKRNLITYKRALTLLASGKLDPTTITRVIQDEAHHLDNTNIGIDEFLGGINKTGLTATKYRGNPVETKKLLEYYNYNVHQLITIVEAAKRGVISIPKFEVVPLINDDIISVKQGQFVAAEVDRAVSDKIEDLENLIKSRYWTGQRYTRPIMLTFNSVASCKEAYDRFGIPCQMVIGETTERQETFDRVIACETLLIQVSVVGEGVDLPIRVLIDAAPTVSPVRWMQRVGRITRPIRGNLGCQNCQGSSGYWSPDILKCPKCLRSLDLPEPPPEYVCTNHNLLRHGYLFEGMVPAGVFKDYKKKWPNWEPNTRNAARVIGDIKSLGRFRPAEVPLSDGTSAMGFCLDDPTGRGHQYAALMHPATDKMIVARRDWQLDTEGNRDYNKPCKWVSVPDLPDLTGYSSVPAGPLTPAQAAWWERSADTVGLDRNSMPSNRAFQFLPILLNLRLKVKV